MIQHKAFSKKYSVIDRTKLALLENMIIASLNENNIGMKLVCCKRLAGYFDPSNPVCMAEHQTAVIDSVQDAHILAQLNIAEMKVKTL